MDPASQRLTTFNTLLGRYCYTRMPFDVKSAQEIFQKRMVQHFGDLPGVETDIDDILEWGATKEEHNQRLKAVLQRCNDIHMTLNKEKMSFWIIESNISGPYNQCRRNISRPGKSKGNQPNAPT